jgi:pyrophosphatase PpaX
MITTILFDLDGVLVDAVELHETAFIDAVETISGKKITRQYHAEELNGLPSKEKLKKLGFDGKTADLINQCKQLMTADAIRRSLFLDKEKRAMLEELSGRKYNIGCVTNSIRKTTTLMLVHTGLYDLIDFIVTNEDVSHPKPHPGGYWQAMTHFGSNMKTTMIIEDSDVGVHAAQQSGANYLHVKGPEEVTLENIERAIERCER